MTRPPAHDLETVRYRPDELTTYHRNPRRGNIEAIAESLETNGQYRPIVVNLGRQTGRPLEVLAGNHTLAAARQLGWTEIVATTIDVTDQQAARIVAADNRTADLGDYDNDVLTALLADLAAAALPVTKPGAAFYTFLASTYQGAVQAGLEAAGVYISSHLVWVKNTFTLSRSDYHWRHEACIYGWNPAGPHTWYGDRTVDTLLRDDTPDLQKMTKAELVALLEEAITASTVHYADKPTANREHPTMKPVSLLTPLLENSTPIAGTVLDSTAGSGSIMIAAHHTGRTAYMVELDPVYCDVICRRWQAHTGQAPQRDGDPHPTNF